MPIIREMLKVTLSHPSRYPITSTNRENPPRDRHAQAKLKSERVRNMMGNPRLRPSNFWGSPPLFFPTGP